MAFIFLIASLVWCSFHQPGGWKEQWPVIPSNLILTCQLVKVTVVYTGRSGSKIANSFQINHKKHLFIAAVNKRGYAVSLFGWAALVVELLGVPFPVPRRWSIALRLGWVFPRHGVRAPRATEVALRLFFGSRANERRSRASGYESRAE